MFGLADYFLNKTKETLYKNFNSYSVVKNGNVVYLVIKTFGKIKDVSFENIYLISKGGLVFEVLRKEDLKVVQTEKSVILKINNPPSVRQFVVGEDEILVKNLFLRFDCYEALVSDRFK